MTNTHTSSRYSALESSHNPKYAHESASETAHERSKRYLTGGIGSPEHSFGGVHTGVGEGSPEVFAVAGHGVVEAAVAQQPEVGQPGVPGGRRVVGGQVDPAAAEQIGGQTVYRLQHGQPTLGHFHAPRRRSPGRVLAVGAVCVGRNIAGGEGRVVLVLQVDGMVMVQGETLSVVLGQLRVKPGLPFGPGFLSGVGCRWSVE